MKGGWRERAGDEHRTPGLLSEGAPPHGQRTGQLQAPLRAQPRAHSCSNTSQRNSSAGTRFHTLGAQGHIVHWDIQTCPSNSRMSPFR